MDQQRILDELLALLKGAGVKVRKEAMGGNAGGLCLVKGQYLLFYDTDSPLAETSVRCAQAVTKLVDIEAVYVRPEVRQFIEHHANSVA